MIWKILIIVALILAIWANVIAYSIYSILKDTKKIESAKEEIKRLKKVR